MLTIGEFSRLSRVSALMLRHYDAIGLLRPAHTGTENGYRYYEEGQLAELVRIERLKSYGFSLAEVSALLPLSEEELARHIHQKRVSAYSQLHELRKTLRRMEEDVIQMEGTNMAAENYPVIVMENPEQRVYSFRKKIQIGEMHDLFQELYREMEKLGLKRAGVTQAIYHGEEFNYDSADVEAQAVVSGDAPGVKTLPACTCAAVTHTGPYDTLKYAYDALCAWLGKHPEYRVCGPAIERYIRDENMVESLEEMETGVMFPVEKV